MMGMILKGRLWFRSECSDYEVFTWCLIHLRANPQCSLNSYEVRVVGLIYSQRSLTF